MYQIQETKHGRSRDYQTYCPFHLWNKEVWSKLMHNNTALDIAVYYICIHRKVCPFVGLDQSQKYQPVPLHMYFGSVEDILHSIFHVLGRYHQHDPTVNGW